ncbi:hypothetical protein WMY93_012355 [Mugilogobius chulae]|uniref:Eukaryotic translation initiation factor 4E nuclear import factor 1 n=1 Tax=Mugilogobius chulae TaxID=88201 RepID=A0AAW0P8U4_9GOBI
MLSPSFTPTSVIRKMYATKDKCREEPGSRTDSKDDASIAMHSQTAPAQCGSSRSHLVLSSSCLPSPFNPHVPMVRPPPQLHPNVVQRMLAQGIQPQQLGPALMQAGILPPHMDLAQLQGLPPALLGPPLYPLNAAGHPLLPPRPNAHMQLAAMQQLQQQRQMHPGSLQSQNQGPHRASSSQRHGNSPPLGLAKWFGSDVLEQPLPSMPAKVISVDELEFRP